MTIIKHGKIGLFLWASGSAVDAFFFSSYCFIARKKVLAFFPSDAGEGAQTQLIEESAPTQESLIQAF